MPKAVHLSDQLVNDARRHAKGNGRSLSKQIEHWSRIGKIVEENPDLPYSFIRDILLGREAVKRGEVTEFRFD